METIARAVVREPRVTLVPRWAVANVDSMEGGSQVGPALIREAVEGQ